MNDTRTEPIPRAWRARPRDEHGRARNGRSRWAAAMAAALMFGAVLALATGSPASAANTASVDLNSNGSRPLAGATRYSTSLAIAEAFVDYADETSGAFIDSAVIVSGEGFADALSAAALAGQLNAPILLTQPNRLSTGIRSFLDDEGIDDVFIVGGTAAVSQAVEDTLERNVGVDVTRIAGADRFETALEVARRVDSEGGVGEFCASRDFTVLVANGRNFADALAGGPIAYRGPHPIILTERDALPEGATNLLADLDIEQAIILGGTAAVSSAVADQLANAGVDEVDRWAGSDRYATAVEVAREMISRRDTCDFTYNRIALTSGESPYDGLSGGPLLGERGATLLMVRPGSLPSVTRNFLAATPQRDDGVALHITFDVLGGTAAVRASVADAAVDAAATAKAITATISAQPGTKVITVKFSEPVDAADAESLRNYTITAGRSNDPEELLAGFDAVEYDAETRTATITLDADDSRGNSDTAPYFAGGDVITLLGGQIRAADHPEDQRRVPETRFRVANDRRPPTINLFVPTGGEVVFATLSEPLHDAPGRDGPGGRISNFTVTVRRSGSSSDEQVTLMPHNASGNTLLWSGTIAAPVFASGDRVTLPARTVWDGGGNPNRLERATVASQSPPTLVEASVTTVMHTTQASAILPWVGLEIAAKSTGRYAGAEGNDWSVVFSEGDTRPNVSVSSRQVVRIGYPAPGRTDDEFTIRDLIDELDKSSSFNLNFTVVGREDLESSDYRVVVDAHDERFDLAGGRTTVSVRADWNQPIKEFDATLAKLCQSTCTSRSRPPIAIPGDWEDADGSANAGVVTSHLAWTVVVDDNNDVVPTTTMSLLFEEGAVTGFGDLSAARRSRTNVEVARRLRR